MVIIRRLASRALAGALVAVVAGAFATPVNAAPTLSVSNAEALSALTCSGDLAAAGPRPVLFIHGTTSSSQANWSWNWARALDARRWAHCEIDLPASGNNDIQRAAEYVTRAIEIMHSRAGRRISIVGHSQGGMIARWSLKYWPGTRAMVDDYVGLASSNHGTRVFRLQCTLMTRCTAAQWQQRDDSRFIAALNAGTETYPGISYTEVATTLDEVVVPYTSTWLHGPAEQVTNTTSQALCPIAVVEHLGMAYDNAAWLIGLDALSHSGPARLARIDRSTCSQPFMPGVDPRTFPVNVAAAALQTARSSATAELLTAEPPLAPYAR